MRVALVMTVKNEERLLKQNVLYHLGIGVDMVFVYFDQTTDNGPKTLLNLERVEVLDSVKPEFYHDLPYLEKFWSNATEHHTARQCLNTYDALQKCKSRHIDWLISLDADELFLSSKDGSLSLEQFFKVANNKNIDIVNLRPLEVVARKMRYKNVMVEETLFKTQKNFSCKFDQIYQRIYDPYKNHYKTVSYWLGHTMGKAAIRVNSSVIPYNVHRYTSLSKFELKAASMGYLLHYHIYDSEDFIKKFKNFKERPTTFLSGNKIEYLKSLWIRLVNDKKNSTLYLESYFKSNLLFTDKKLRKLQRSRLGCILKRKESAIVIIDLPKQTLNRAKAENKL